MNINIKAIKPATPWNVSIAKLTSLENTIAASEGEALKARWSFGRELVNQRVNYKGRLVIPSELMTLTMTKCGLGRSEISRRVQFAIRYPTKDLMSNAVRSYPSWRQMMHEGLVEKTRTAPKKKATPPAPAGRWVIRRLAKEVDKAFAQHTALTRDQVTDLEQLYAAIKNILEQVDRNDALKVKAS
jgi:hypothetical protein